jgi:microcystin-dependent protein
MVDLVPNARQQFVDLNQSPLVGGKVYMYLPNTTIFKTTFQDQAGIIPNPNPIILDDIGSAAIWGQGLYRQVVTDSLGNVLWDALTNPSGELNSTGTNAGCIVWFAAGTPPTGFLTCDGSAVSRTLYNLLFAAIGTTWGVGDGTATFNLPDLRGYFLRAWDDGAGVDPGRVFGTTQHDGVNPANITLTLGSLAATGTIAGTLTLPGNPGAGHGAEDGGQNIGKDGTYAVTVTSGELVPTIVLTGAPGLTAQTETRPINIALLPCISTGAGPGNTNGGAITGNIFVVSGGSNHQLVDATQIFPDMIVLVDTSTGASTISAPTNPVPGQIIWIKDSSGHANTHNITISFQVDNTNPVVLNTAWAVCAIVNFGGSGWVFLVKPS